MQSVIDERASDPQRRTLVAILQGEGADPGAVMFQIYRTMCVTPRPKGQLVKVVQRMATPSRGRAAGPCRCLDLDAPPARRGRRDARRR
jgi:hypothetical protein